MATKKEGAELYDTILSFPLMNQEIKVSMKISRKYILLIALLIEHGIVHGDRDKVNEILLMIPDEAKKGLSDVAKELLSKAELGQLPDRG